MLATGIGRVAVSCSSLVVCNDMVSQMRNVERTGYVDSGEHTRIISRSDVVMSCWNVVLAVCVHETSSASEYSKLSCDT